MGGREGGATLVEVMVTAALILVAVLAGGSLIVHSVKLERAVTQTLNDPAADQAVEWMRRDVHAAAALHAGSLLWTGEALELKFFDGSIVRYSQLDGTLLRRQRDLDGVELTRRVVLRQMHEWRWRTPTVDLLEVTLVLPGHGDPTRVATKAGHSHFGVTDLKSTHALFSLRSPGRRSW